MIKDISKRIITGIAFGGVVTFIFITFLMIKEIDITASEVWQNMLGSFALGIYFGLGSLIFEYDIWSPLKRTMLHFSLSLIVYFFVALPLEWVPFTLPAVLVTIILFTLVYAINWTGFWIYFKKVEASMNDVVEQKK